MSTKWSGTQGLRQSRVGRLSVEAREKRFPERGPRRQGRGLGRWEGMGTVDGEGSPVGGASAEGAGTPDVRQEAPGPSTGL